MAMILLKSFNTNIYPYICVFRVVFKKVPKMIKKQFFFLYMKKSTIIENYTFTLQLIIVNVVQFAWMFQTNIGQRKLVEYTTEAVIPSDEDNIGEP